MPKSKGWIIRSRKYLGTWMLVNRDMWDTPEQRLSPMTFYSRERAEAVLEALQKTGLTEEIAWTQDRAKWHRKRGE